MKQVIYALLLSLIPFGWLLGLLILFYNNEDYKKQDKEVK